MTEHKVTFTELEFDGWRYEVDDPEWRDYMRYGYGYDETEVVRNYLWSREVVNIQFWKSQQLEFQF